MKQLSSCLFVVAALGCSTDSEPAAPQEEGPREVRFPPGFMWGSASAAFQVEKGLGNTDWGIWVKTPGKIKNGDDPDVGGADAFAHVAEDVGYLKATNQNTYRFSIEWARLYPTRAAFDADQPDADAVKKYDELFTALKSAGIKPMVTLQHFSLPDWLSDPRKPEEPQGWERTESITLFGEWCARAAARWQGEVDWWVTINEPMVAPLAGYVQGSFPPGLTLKIDRALLVGKNEALAHAKCYDAIKQKDPTSMVGIVQHMRDVEPDDPNEPGDVAAAARVRHVNNAWILDAVISGDWDDEFDGKLDGPKDRRADPELKGRSDYVGINYYSAVTAGTRGLVLPVVNAAIRTDRLLTERPKTDFSWDIHPKGLRNVLEEVRKYNQPIVITENGIADSADSNRARFILEHLYELGRARDSGLDIRGFIYWSLLDNFEWASGFCPRFGLYSVDPATKTRAQRASAAVYKEVAGTNVVTRDMIQAQRPYTEPKTCE